MSGGETTLLKRYPNRRLYDTRRSRYVTLDEVAAMLAEGEDIRVVESRSGRDVTRALQMKILLDAEEAGSAEEGRFVRLHKCPFCERLLSSTEKGR